MSDNVAWPGTSPPWRPSARPARARRSWPGPCTFCTRPCTTPGRSTTRWPPATGWATSCGWPTPTAGSCCPPGRARAEVPRPPLGAGRPLRPAGRLGAAAGRAAAPPRPELPAPGPGIADDSAGLTDEHKAIAEYWADGPASETRPATGACPPGRSRTATATGWTRTCGCSSPSQRHCWTRASPAGTPSGPTTRCGRSPPSTSCSPARRSRPGAASLLFAGERLDGPG
jgi:hypothetical protein